jgi:queuine/archaeosine tRNA-ribosyltransferase
MVGKPKLAESRVPDLTALETRAGTIGFPAYIPVTTFGKKYPLDDLIRPYLPRLAPAVMVSLHYARQMTERPRLPVLIDSGGFAALFEGSVLEEEHGLGVLVIPGDEGHSERVEPKEVLEFQEQKADVAFTLDFPIPPGLAEADAKRRQALTIANALWAIENRRRRDLPLYACVQGWDIDSYRACAASYIGLDFDGIAIGGLVPRISDLQTALGIVDAVRAFVPDKPLHVFGLGKPAIVDVLFERGVQSVDSSSYVKLAADGRFWGEPTLHLADASPGERLHLALCNLAMAAQRALPLSTSRLLFGSRLWDSSAKRTGKASTTIEDVTAQP